jgi:adenylate cyclase
LHTDGSERHHDDLRSPARSFLHADRRHRRGNVRVVDLAGFTAVTDAHGDAEAVSICGCSTTVALDVLQPGDELVTTIGDALMLRFPTPDGAIVARRELRRERVL